MPVFNLNKKKEPIEKPTPKGEYLIFVVDDNEVFAKLVAEFLRVKLKEKNYPQPIEIELLHSADRCLESLYLQPELIILDYFLTGSVMNGDKLYKKIIEANPQQRVIMLSGQDDASVVHHLIQLGVRNYVMKDDPEMFEELYKLVIEALDSV